MELVNKALTSLKLGAMAERWVPATKTSVSPWDEITLNELKTAIASPTPGIPVITGQGPFAPIAMVHERRGETYYALMAAPATFAFQTRKGNLGILQVIRFTEDPRGMRIRYKLMQPAAPAPVMASLPVSVPASAVPPTAGAPLALD